ncbi:MAG: response regulator [Planctomycetes bacterium]|nr:response regulator [Planctomycetota bacterium]
MFLLQRIDFIALLGLMVQTFVAWVFVAIFASLRKRGTMSQAFDAFYFAFIALSASLTIVSVRFFQAFDVAEPRSFWVDGGWPAMLSYATYQALKGVFAVQLLRGAHLLAGRTPPASLALAWRPLLLVMAVPAFFIDSVTPLLALQAPVIVGAALWALRTLARSRSDHSGWRVVRWALIGLAASWTVHGVSALTSDFLPGMSKLLALNSFIDLAVQILLGSGLIISVMHEDHRRVLLAEQEREQLRRTLERDDRLRALGTLVSGVAHELNNPLTVILGYADELSHGASSEQAARIVGEQAERCRGIVRSLSALAGPAVHPRRELEVQELVERVVRGLGPDLAAERRLVIEPMGGLRMHVDRIGMEQVLTNLIVNALHVTPHSGRVTIAASATARGVELTVTDQGPGVPSDLRARLFEPFFTTKEPGKGTGLGLSIAHAVVRGHGGTILIEDGPKRVGACFRVVIPPATDVGLAQREPTPQLSVVRSLFVIDDDESVRSVVRLHAERRGWKVREAESVEAALAQRERFDGADVVLCDLRMPGLGGIGLFERLEREDPAALARVVFASGDLASPEVVQFARHCRRPLLHKPFDFDELFTTLGRSSPSRVVASS